MKIFFQLTVLYYSWKEVENRRRGFYTFNYIFFSGEGGGHQNQFLRLPSLF